jgi:hypothetical protein
MHWNKESNNGDWKVRVSTREHYFQYKYVVVEERDHKRINPIWETGLNRLADLRLLRNEQIDTTILT